MESVTNLIDAMNAYEQTGVPDELVWETVRQVPGLASIESEEFEFVRQGLQRNPNAVHELIARSESATVPARYFVGALRKTREKGGWPLVVQGSRAASGTRERLLERCRMIVVNTRRAEVWETEEEWRRYALAELEQAGLSMQEAELLANAVSGPVTVEEHTLLRLQREGARIMRQREREQDGREGNDVGEVREGSADGGVELQLQPDDAHVEGAGSSTREAGVASPGAGGESDPAALARQGLLAHGSGPGGWSGLEFAVEDPANEGVSPPEWADYLGSQNANLLKGC